MEHTRDQVVAGWGNGSITAIRGSEPSAQPLPSAWKAGGVTIAASASNAWFWSAIAAWVSGANLEQLRRGGHGYVFGRNRRRSGEIFDYIQSATGPRIECPIGIAASEKSLPPKTLVQGSPPHRAIEIKLKAARLDLSATNALSALKSVRVVDIDLGNRTTKRYVTRRSQRAATILRALGITDLDPPTPATPGQTIM